MPVIATAGHVDHGKSTLIEALTGRDPDRLEEEKRRGLTIDLGFAWMSLPSGRTISFVDVPGHRRFIGNMLAGVGPVSSALLVVAADEGWKPQTEEHLAVLDLLETERVVVALTKVDLVEEISPAVEQVRDRLRGTMAEEAMIVAVSARTGVGLADLQGAIDEIASDDPDQSRPHLWVDRVFVAPGAGTVVTGTLLGGSVRVGDTLVACPGERVGRVRGVQSHDTKRHSVEPGTRVGINFAGLEHTDVERGSRIAPPGAMRETRRVHVRLRAARYVEELPERGAYHLHVGTAEVGVRLRKLGSEFALLDLAMPLWLQASDRFVIRDSGRQLVVAGGVILDPAPSGRGRDVVARSEALTSALRAGPDALASELLRIRGVANRGDLRAWSGGGRVDGIDGSEVVLSPSSATELTLLAERFVGSFVREHPLEVGVGVGALASEMSIEESLVRPLVEQSQQLELRGSLVSVKGHMPAAVDERWASLQGRLQSAAPPTLAELKIDPELLRRLLRDGSLVRVAANLVYLPAELDAIVTASREFGHPFTVSDFRQRLGISRKYAVPLLEYLDREGITTRDGDLRTAR